MATRTIASPGVEIREYDLSTVAETPVGTSVFLMGFADKGPTDEILEITTFEEFESIYGLPTNAAERYFYHTAEQLYSSNANVYASRLPYGNDRGEGFGNSYGALIYPVLSALSAENINSFKNLSDEQIEELVQKRVETDLETEISNYIRTNNLSTFSNIDEEHALAISQSPWGIENQTWLSLVYEHKNEYYLPIDYIGDINAADLSTLSTLSGNDGNYVIESTKSINDITQESIEKIREEIVNENDSLYIAVNELSSANYIEFGAPKHVDLTKSEYQNISENGINWSNTVLSSFDSISSIGGAGIVILNSSQTTINNQFEGYYIGMCDNSNMAPGSVYDSILHVNSVNSNSSLSAGGANYIELPETRINFSLSSAGASQENSISEIMENIPSYNIFGPEFYDMISFGLFKIRKSVFSPDVIKLDYVLQEAYTGSFDYWRTSLSPNGGNDIRLYLGNQINKNSNNIQIFINDNISNKNTETWLDLNGNPTKKVRFASNARALYPIGSYTSTVVSDKTIGSLPEKIDRVLEKIDNPELIDLDLTMEAGLGTIWTYTLIGDGRIVPSDTDDGIKKWEDVPNAKNIFDDTIDVTNVITNGDLSTAKGSFYNTSLVELTGSSNAVKTAYNTIFNKFVIFAEKTRKDHLFIADPLRFTCIKGSNLKILQAVDENGEVYSFSRNVYWPMRYQFMSANSSYAAVYGNWGKVYDSSIDNYIWIPMSGTMASIIAYSSDTTYPWYAPAGFTRGLVSTVDDIALYTNQKQRDQFYKISINPVAYFPNDGIAVYGQKTLLSKPSAFDRINIRRLFLYLEKTCSNTLKYFVFEPNTYTTRTRVFNTLDPIFNRVKLQDGMYGYKIVVNNQNNTADVIDANEMVIDIYVSPVHPAEFILCNFYATRTGAVEVTENV